MSTDRFLILGLDGLRADMVTPELTPNLLRLAERGVFFRQHHAVFPTVTRVNVSSLVTGANSGTHGIVNNSIFEPSISPHQPVDCGQYDVVEAADVYYQGALFSTPSLGEILVSHGDRMVAISSGTTGSNRLMHHKVKIGVSTDQIERLPAVGLGQFVEEHVLARERAQHGDVQGRLDRSRCPEEHQVR